MGSQNIGLYDITIQRKRQAAQCVVPGGPRPRAQIDQRLLLRASGSVRTHRRHPVQFHQLARRDLRAVAVEKHRQYRAESVQHAAARSRLGPVRTSTPPRCTKNGRATSNRTRRSTGGSPPRRTSICSWISTMAAPSRGACAASAKRRGRTTSRPTSISPIPTAACGPTPTAALPCGTFVYPTQLGGHRVFNANGIPQNTVPITANFTGRNRHDRHAGIARRAFANPNALDHEDAGIGRQTTTATPRSPRCASMDTTTSTTASTSISACATAFAAPVTTGTPWSRPCTPAWVPATRTDVWCVMSVPM